MDEGTVVILDYVFDLITFFVGLTALVVSGFAPENAAVVTESGQVTALMGAGIVGGTLMISSMIKMVFRTIFISS